MNVCMGTDKPQISILMAIYEPRIDWLREQLLSLDAQTYPNLKLYIRDDCSPTVPYDVIQSCVKDCIRTLPYEISRNETNMGSNGTFQRLTEEAEGTLFAYCDQDDVWMPEKLSDSFDLLSAEGAVMVCGDVRIVDASGNTIADSITRYRKRHVFQSGSDCLSVLLYRNFAVGCTMLLPAEVAKSACPFPASMVHDHWLAIYASSMGAIAHLQRPCMNYRQHGNNQTGVLSRVSSKESYYEQRVLAFLNRIEDVAERISHPEIDRAYRWGLARKEHYLHGLKKWLPLFQMRKINKATTVFELIMFYMPRPMFLFVVREIKKGRL